MYRHLFNLYWNLCLKVPIRQSLAYSIQELLIAADKKIVIKKDTDLSE